MSQKIMNSPEGSFVGNDSNPKSAIIFVIFMGCVQGLSDRTSLILKNIVLFANP